jgi:hypothetical protein
VMHVKTDEHARPSNQYGRIYTLRRRGIVGFKINKKTDQRQTKPSYYPSTTYPIKTQERHTDSYHPESSRFSATELTLGVGEGPRGV